MTKEEKQIYNEVVITTEELMAEAGKYDVRGRNVYLPMVREFSAAKIYGQPDADGTGMALAGCLGKCETLAEWVEHKMRMARVIDLRGREFDLKRRSIASNKINRVRRRKA